ncbi:MAG: ribonuclease P protein component [Planctomycetota bacterium]|nr:ribonuclease P protein component [Planctomycetota bacterium]
MTFRFGPHQRLRSRVGFDAVYATRRSRRVGPLLVFVRRGASSNGPRLGLSLPKRVGNAVTRNRIRRCLREAFRLQQQEWAEVVVVVINVRPHQPLVMEEYAAFLREARLALLRPPT